jgi:hypothetical protein
MINSLASTTEFSYPLFQLNPSEEEHIQRVCYLTNTDYITINDNVFIFKTEFRKVFCNQALSLIEFFFQKFDKMVDIFVSFININKPYSINIFNKLTFEYAKLKCSHFVKPWKGI